MTKSPVLILGARSDIGIAVAHKFAALGHPIQLAARNSRSLISAQMDIQVRYNVAVSIHEFDVIETSTHETFVNELPLLPIVVVSAIGLMGIQNEDERNPEAAIIVMRSNYEGPANIISILANRFIDRGDGTIVGISSVAGERGRQKNYIYGSAKAGFTAYLSGLRNRAFKHGVHIVTVIPGFVYTKMTDGMNLPSILTAKPNEVADAILLAVSQKQNVIYVRSIWRAIILIIRNIPELIFLRLNI